MWKISRILGALCSLLLLLAGSASFVGVAFAATPAWKMEGRRYFLGHNLHVDQLNKVSSVNYQIRGELLPWGSEVRIERVSRNYLVFEDVASHRRYRYEFHWKTKSTVPLSEHLERVFLKSAEALQLQVAGLAEIDQDGIYEGRVKLGMSREGVLIAIGYPPEFANRAELLTDREWLYWVSRHSKMVVGFGRDGLVNRITGDY